MSRDQTPRDHPRVQAALTAGRLPADILVAACRHCGLYSYHGSPPLICHWCGWSAGEDELNAMRAAGDIITLADYDDEPESAS